MAAGIDPARALQEVYGLSLSSPFALPGAGVATSALADLTIAEGPATLPDAAVPRGPYRQLGEQIELTIPAAGRFLLAGPGRLEVAPKLGVETEVLTAFLVASGLPMLLWQRGGLLLHASGVELDGKAIAIAGPSGVGKSTLARALLERGGRLIGDDTLWLTDPANPALAAGLSGGQFLRNGDELRFAVLPLQQRAEVTVLDAVAILSRGAPGPSRLRPIEAVQSLLKLRHRPALPAMLGQEAAVLAHCTRLAAAVPIFTLGLEEGAIERAADALAAI
ncbi:MULTISPECIES: hypothetical protein [unclassified Novosphingobium]|uniref:hypothetical protein n=1 Tax=unclassified Novosphingobium TaxID=2644732 RepID=UPI000EE0B1E3|nr:MULTISPECIES: hypothetical protein [unclassified Novosphingobium]HCF25100.1 hypothetical protein [Novosphingobium sp.]HQV02282.1 hypothetical protein [Novosphingobium sp.]